jgi:hypothetical protein
MIFHVFSTKQQMHQLHLQILYTRSKYNDIPDFSVIGLVHFANCTELNKLNDSRN